jgi:hypothetical protein
MVLSSLDNQGHGSPPCLPDVAAYRGKSWLVRLQRRLRGVTPRFYPILGKMLGDTGTGTW